MTKVAMIDVIEKSEVIVNFNRSHFMRSLKQDVEFFYKLALEFIEKNKEK